MPFLKLSVESKPNAISFSQQFIRVGLSLDFLFTATHWDSLLNLVGKAAAERVRKAEVLPLIFNNPAIGKTRP